MAVNTKAGGGPGGPMRHGFQKPKNAKHTLGTVSYTHLITFEQALNRSCNVAFAQIAIQLGAEKLTATAQQLGFNQAFAVIIVD